MAILKIARMGHPILRRRADEVPDPTAPGIGLLVEDMLETLRDERGAGLAAPQVHVPKRVVIFAALSEVPEDPEDEADEADEADESEFAPLTVLVNPAWAPLGEAMTIGWEACLSVPGLTGAVPRFSHIRYRGVTPAGEKIEREATGFHARVFQHEFDHLDGILYPQRMADLSLLVFADEAHRSGLPSLGGEQEEKAEEAEAAEAAE